MCSIFPFSNDLFGCNLSIQGLLNKIPVLFLQIQGVFKEKVIFKEFSRTEQFFQEYSSPCEPCHQCYCINHPKTGIATCTFHLKVPNSFSLVSCQQGLIQKSLLQPK